MGEILYFMRENTVFGNDGQDRRLNSDHNLYSESPISPINIRMITPPQPFFHKEL